MWQSIEDEPSLEEDASFGVLLQGIGICHRELGDFEQARVYFAWALGEHEKRGATAEMVRNRWSLAMTLVAAGHLEEALPVLRRTWHEFDELHMEADAALVGLEVAEVLLVMGRPDEVPHICRTLLDSFVRNGMTSRAITALAFLREAIALGKTTPSLVRHVHDFLRDLPKYPARPFVPPQF